jgi:hypothetical protein
MLLPALYTELTTGSASLAVQQALAQVGAGSLPAPAGAVFISFADKVPTRPFLVMNLVAAPPAEATLDGISALIEGEIQFDSYADTPQQARTLSQAVKTFLMVTFLGGVLPDGTTIQFVDVTMDHDEPYEMGGVGYLYRCLLRLKAFYSESGGFGPSGGGASWGCLTKYFLTPSPDGSTVAFETVPAVTISANALLFRNGVKQSTPAEYTYAGLVITWVNPPAAGDDLELYQ